MAVEKVRLWASRLPRWRPPVAIAGDALELIEVEYELLPTIRNPDDALAADAPRVFEHQRSNVIQDRSYTWGDVDRCLPTAAHVYGRFRWNRVGASPMETFGCVCQWDVVNHSLTCYGSYQTPGFIALGRAASLTCRQQGKGCCPPHGGSLAVKAGAWDRYSGTAVAQRQTAYRSSILKIVSSTCWQVPASPGIATYASLPGGCGGWYVDWIQSEPGG